MKKTNLLILFFIIIIALVVYFVFFKGASVNTINDEILETESKNFKITISSPVENDEYCFGETIPIIFTAPRNIKSVDLTYWGIPSIETKLGSFRTIRDVEGKMIETTINWDQEAISPYRVIPSFSARIEVSGRDENNYSKVISGKTGPFAIIDCN